MGNFRQCLGESDLGNTLTRFPDCLWCVLLVWRNWSKRFRCRGEGEEEHLVSSVCACIYNLHTTQLHWIMTNFSLPAESPHCRAMLFVRHIQKDLKSAIYHFDSNGLHCFVQGDVVCRVGEHQHRLAHWCSPCKKLCTHEVWNWT